MGGFTAVKPYKSHRVVVLAETHGPRSAKQQHEFREALKRLLQKHATVMLPPKTPKQRNAFKKAVKSLLATNLVPEKAKAKTSKRKR